MKLYCTTYIDDEKDDEHYGRSVVWNGTQADQKKAVKALKSDGMRDINPMQVDVPTDKEGLLCFLNQHDVVVQP